MNIKTCSNSNKNLFMINEKINETNNPLKTVEEQATLIDQNIYTQQIAQKPFFNNRKIGLRTGILSFGILALAAVMWPSKGNVKMGLSNVNKENQFQEPYQCGVDIRSFKDFISLYATAKKCPFPQDFFSHQYCLGKVGKLNEEDMTLLYGKGRILGEEEGRKLYQLLVTANAHYAKLSVNFEDVKKEEVAEDAVNTRHAIRMYTRSVCSEQSQRDAELIDETRYGNKEGLTLEQIKKKYHNNAILIIEKTGSTNEAVNEYFNLLPNNPTVRSSMIWLGVKLKLI
jgi:hypothetical protein